MADEKKKTTGSIAARAWNATKDKNDPEFDAIPEPEFKNDLEFRARKVQETGTAITNFEKEVQRLDVEDKKEQKALGGPMSVVEEPPEITVGASAGLTEPPKAEKASTKAKPHTKATKAEPKGQRATDKSGHVPDAKEAAANVKEQLNAPKHP